MDCLREIFDVVCDESSLEATVLAISKNQLDEFIIQDGRIYFNLKDGERAKEFGRWISKPSFSMQYNDRQGQNMYTHSLSIAVNGVGETTINKVLSGLESDYFIAVKTTRDEVLIYGFESLMTVENYSYSDGGVISIESIEEEYEKPLFFSQNFSGDIIGAKEAFDNRFENLPFDVLGDFNDDFNDDFYK